MKIKLPLIAIIITSSLFFFSCEKEFFKSTDKVKVNFTNSTGHQLKNLKIGEQSLGILEDNIQTGYIDFEEFAFDGNTPVKNMEALIEETAVLGYTPWCGTNLLYPIKKGTFEMDINLVQVSDFSNSGNPDTLVERLMLSKRN